MHSIIIRKIASLYAACSPELGVVSYGTCQDEALNNLNTKIVERQSRGEGAFLLNMLVDEARC